VSSGSGLANVRFGTTQGTSNTISFLSAQDLTAASYTSMFSVARSSASLAVSAAVAATSVTLTFAANEAGLTQAFATYNLVGGNAIDGITSAFGITAGTATFNGGISIPNFS
jgi:hypothetical protein